jgi:DNA repair exonuclease SbcCD ATPase subunit
MLLTPRRNEETDLIGKYSSYKDHYQALEEQITEQMNQHAVCADNLNEMQQHLNEDYDQFDSIAPATPR